ncbi:methyltransferase [Saprospiraceae bacterium]|nr:methyltransferase [Saprospiraceae bacterium]
MKDSFFHFQHFNLRNKNAAFKINTDGVLLAAWADLTGAQTLLDIGTGTGVIAHICHYRFPDTMITGVDIDEGSYEEALFNVNHNSFTKSINIVHTDVRSWKSEKTYDHVITNPPYFSNGTLPDNNKLSLAKHTGSLNTKDLWNSINRLTHKDSKVSIILPVEAEDEHIEAANSVNFYANRICYVKNRSQGKLRRILIEYSRINTPCIKDELCIHSDGEEYYSDAFKELHQDLNMIFKK